ncbi:Hypothetical Protein FCC1311_022052 [Hondaea fermentalgiana]|uniref:Uncharacterized protein n=1 Tax=Hondaea fermentalgiana TaxID=2315210 RepID=A0A2R5G625_9STRA|nr:Hypothetical Protein FCC1311_022052 [Hondaea fermentalgiana]|eukprot:GBG25985.1 Hypothetical Protein FCC1311_022052 [Hondaea fermentalgiana]
MESIQKNCRIVLRKLMSSGCVDLVPCAIPAVALAAEKSRFSAMSLLIRDCGVRRALGKPYRAPMIAQQAFELFSKQARRVAQICFQDGACLREQYASASDDALARIIAMAYGSTLITSGVSGEHLMDRSTALMLDFLGHVRGTKLTAVTALRTARY